MFHYKARKGKIPNVLQANHRILKSKPFGTELITLRPYYKPNDLISMKLLLQPSKPPDDIVLSKCRLEEAEAIKNKVISVTVHQLVALHKQTDAASSKT